MAKRNPIETLGVDLGRGWTVRAYSDGSFTVFNGMHDAITLDAEQAARFVELYRAYLASKSEV